MSTRRAAQLKNKHDLFLCMMIFVYSRKVSCYKNILNILLCLMSLNDNRLWRHLYCGYFWCEKNVYITIIKLRTNILILST